MEIADLIKLYREMETVTKEDAILYMRGGKVRDVMQTAVIQYNLRSKIAHLNSSQNTQYNEKGGQI